MNRDKEINQAGIGLIQSFESLRLKKYKDSAGLWTVGWGHLIKPGETLNQVTRQQADELFLDDLEEAQDAVRSLVTKPLTDNQYAALVSFVFNVGTGAFRRSTLLRKLNTGDYKGAAVQFGAWVNAGKQKRVRGLIRRRAAERELFETPDDAPAMPLISRVSVPDEDMRAAESEAVTPSPDALAREQQPAPVQEGAQVTGDPAVQVNQIAEPVAPIVSKPDDTPIPATKGGSKSLWATISGGIAGAIAWAQGTISSDRLLIIVGIICLTLVILAFIFRQIIIDYLRGKLAADPHKYTIK